MRRPGTPARGACLSAALLIASAASAATRTSVTLAGRDDAVPKLGVPGIVVRVEAPGADERGAVAVELARELTHQVYTRPLTSGDPGDYDLAIDVQPIRREGAATVIPFTAVLASSRGERLWRVEGRTDVEDAPLDAAVYAGIARNVVAALIHDGWVAPRQNPDDPPPQAPTLRLENPR